jgi:DHA1 family bicyclomycin/chloramphenicol resistance-like MFS transporter
MAFRKKVIHPGHRGFDREFDRRAKLFNAVYSRYDTLQYSVRIERFCEKMSVPVGNGGLVFLLAVTIAAGQLGVSLYLPAMPVIGDDLAISPSWMAMTLSVYFAGFAFFTLVTGPFSDAMGRRFTILRGLEVYSAGTLLCAIAGDIAMLLCGRLLQALGASVAPVVGKAVIQDISTGDRTVVLMGWLGAAMSITPAVAPFIGGIIVEYLEWRWIFWSLLIFNALIWMINLYVLPETRPSSPFQNIELVSMVKTYKEFLRNRTYTKYVLILTMCFGGLGAFYTASPYVFIHGFHLSPFFYGLITLIIVAGFMAGNIGVGILIRSRWSHGTLYIGGFMMCAGAFGMFFIPKVFVMVSTVVATTFLFAFGFGIIYPLITKEALGCFIDQAGSAAALLGFTQRGGSALTSLAVAFVISLSIFPYTAMALIMLICAVFVIITIRCLQRSR